MAQIPAVEVSSLTKAYGRLVAVDHLNLTVGTKQVHGFLGPNGAGKTTTIKILVGLLRPDSGSARIFGVEASGDNPGIRRRMGYMPELPRFPKHLTGEELLDVYGRMCGMSRDDRKKRVPELVKMVGLEGRGRDRIGKYSKGMQQRIGIAQALLNDPELVILDEPSIGLDPVGMVEVRDMVKEIVKTGKTVFFSSHLLAEVQQICDHITIVNKGVALYSGTLEEVSSEVTPSRRIVVELEKPDGRVTEALGVLPNLRVESSGKILTVHVRTKDDLRPEISRAITAAGGVIIGMREEGAGLEEAFLALVGRGS